jgi:HAD superfamily hydrolase (TIGR01509 family)
MKNYRAVLFDLFNTVALFDPEKLPTFTWNGKIVRSTMGEVRFAVERLLPHCPFASFFAAFTEVSRELGEVRVRQLREIPSRERFRRVLSRLGEADSPETVTKAQELSLVHMGLLAAATEVPDAHRRLLTAVHDQHAVALVSNFDHAPTVRAILKRWEIDAFFDAILISDEFGWRKPHGSIFTAALARLGVRAPEALFVGDSPVDDVGGAKAASLEVAWINRDGREYPADVPAPDFVIEDLAAVARLVFPADR